MKCYFEVWYNVNKFNFKKSWCSNYACIPWLWKQHAIYFKSVYFQELCLVSGISAKKLLKPGNAIFFSKNPTAIELITCFSLLCGFVRSDVFETAIFLQNFANCAAKRKRRFWSRESITWLDVQFVTQTLCRQCGSVTLQKPTRKWSLQQFYD